MNIDWDKKLECERGSADCIGIWCGRIYVRCGDTKWLVDSETGEPSDPWMPRVYNAKRKPKEGEVWMCYKEYRGFQLPFKLTPNGWETVGCTYDTDELTPLYPLIKDPSFEE